MNIHGAESNSVILYHSTIVEPATVPGIWKEPLVIKLKQLGQLGGVQCLHRARNSSQAGRPRELAGTSNLSLGHCAGASRPQRPSVAATGSCSSRLGDDWRPEALQHLCPSALTVGPTLRWREGGHAYSKKNFFYGKVSP